VLGAMRRRYTSDAFRGIARELREARPDIAITTDLIVGFPGETDADFRETLALVREVAFVDSFSFKYSVRPGTAAASLERDVVPPARAQARLAELQDLQRELTLAAHRERVGGTTEVLLEGHSRRGNGQFMGRDPYHRVVNFQFHANPACAVSPELEVGSILPVTIVEATPHSLIAEFSG
jgi:tRNA-2-methylthio-N6-dimethylallyladenosine synthase